MKKYLIAICLLATYANLSFAQTNSGSSFFEDTLFWLPSTVKMYVNPDDSAVFEIMTFDEDSLMTDPSIAFTLPGNAIDEYLSTQAIDIDPQQGDVDTAYVWAGISFFSPPGFADNWLTFGPITIPNAGVDIRWIYRYPSGQPNFQDGYEFYADTIGLNPADFSGTPLYSVPDNDPSTIGAIGNWRNAPMQHLDGPTWRGKKVYFAFHHNAGNKLVLYLDNVRIQEAFNVGVEESKNEIFDITQNSPNPFENFTTLDLKLNKQIELLTFTVFDIQGRNVLTSSYNDMVIGKNTIQIDGSEWESGTYYYSVEADGSKVTGKMIKL